MINDFFKKYKNRHINKTAVLFGAGPSLDLYNSNQITSDITIGTNFIGNHKLFNQKSDNYILLDYYFFGDRNRHMEADYKVKHSKFCACEVDGNPHPLHLSIEEAKDLGAIPMGVKNTNQEFAEDISTTPTHGGSVVFHALNFLFYCGVSKIYIVACDCSGNTCFNDVLGINGAENGYEPYINSWKKVNDYVESKMDIELVSVNPVGLKGLFKDVYTYK
jgi:hypothetical protein